MTIANLLTAVACLIQAGLVWHLSKRIRSIEQRMPKPQIPPEVLKRLFENMIGVDQPDPNCDCPACTENRAMSREESSDARTIH